MTFVVLVEVKLVLTFNADFLAAQEPRLVLLLRDFVDVLVLDTVVDFWWLRGYRRVANYTIFTLNFVSSVTCNAVSIVRAPGFALVTDLNAGTCLSHPEHEGADFTSTICVIVFIAVDLFVVSELLSFGSDHHQP